MSLFAQLGSKRGNRGTKKILMESKKREGERRCKERD
jgi:hypothetical protein